MLSVRENTRVKRSFSRLNNECNVYIRKSRRDCNVERMQRDVKKARLDDHEGNELNGKDNFEKERLIFIGGKEVSKRSAFTPVQSFPRKTRCIARSFV